MEDLRKSYNVNNNKRQFNLPNFKIKSWMFKGIAFIAILIFIIFKPTMIGTYVGTWLNDLYVAFTTNLTMTTTDWYTILITILAFIIFYKLLKWSSTK